MNGSQNLIVKLAEDPGFDHYASKDRAVKALQMKEDFLVETALGFLQGKRDDFIIEVAPRVRFPCSAEAFLEAYSRVAPDGCDLRCGLAEQKDGPVEK